MRLLLNEKDKRTKKEKLMTFLSKIFITKIPPCKGYSYFTSCGYEYDCGYAEMENLCEDCCAGFNGFKSIGKIDPRTNRKFQWWNKLKRYK